MANAPRVLCWANRDEWTEIYQCLYSFDDVNLQRKGADRVMAWKSRSGGKLPLAIECTLDLVLAHLEDTQAFAPEVQLILSMALVRFVNGMVDLNQKGLYARSVQAIADEIGLPDWLVDLRHEATHANLPSKHTLRAGVQVALSWLREEYWEAQIKMHKDSEIKLCEMIDTYQALCAKKQKKKKNVEKREKKVKVMAQEIADYVSSNNLWSYLQISLLKNGFKTEVQDDIDLNSSTQDQAAPPSSQLSDEEIKFWNPLLQVLDKESPDFMPLFLVSVLDPQSVNIGDIRMNHLMALVLWILQRCSTFTATFPWLTLLEICMKNPNVFTRDFVTLILREMSSVQDTLKQDILSLVNINFEDSFEKLPDEAYELRSLEQILESNNNNESKSVEQPVQENEFCLSPGWSVSGGETKWNMIPFGEVLGCEYQSTNRLELPELPINQNEMNYDNSAISKDAVGDVDLTEEDTEMIIGYDESDVIDRMSSENDATLTDDVIDDEVVVRESDPLDKDEFEAEIYLF